MNTYLTEVHLADLGAHEFGRAMRMLIAAQARMARSSSATRMLFAGISREDGRLVCLVEAASLASMHSLMGLALLPQARIREITDVASEDLLRGRHPGRDVHP